MKISALRQLFSVETHRQKADNVGFSVPVLSEIEVGLNSGLDPLLATNMRGTFLRTRVSREGCVRFAFSECLLENEDKLLVELVNILSTVGAPASLEEAESTMKQHGVIPKMFVSPVEDSNPNFKCLQCSELEVGLLAAAPDKNGLYTRVGNHVGVLVYNADTTFSLVSL